MGGGLGGSREARRLSPWRRSTRGQGRLGDLQDHLDLGRGTALVAQLQDLRLQRRRSLAGLLMRRRRAVGEALGEALFYNRVELIYRVSHEDGTPQTTCPRDRIR